MNKPRPTWRWWAFCALLWLHRVTRWGWVSDAWAWCILPDWVASREEIAGCDPMDAGEEW